MEVFTFLLSVTTWQMLADDIDFYVSALNYIVTFLMLKINNCDKFLSSIKTVLYFPV